MKKLFSIFLILCVVYFGILFCQNKLGNGHTISYIVNTQNEKFEITETYHKKTRNQVAGYHIEIEMNHTIFPIEIVSSKEKSKIVESVYGFSNDQYQCIYPVGNHLSKLDVLCQKDATIYPYQTMAGIDKEVDSFVATLDSVGYDATAFMDRRSILKSVKGISIYDNLIQNHRIGIENYKGIYLLDSKDLLREKQLFQKDVYQKSVALFYNNYYIVADYNEKYEFHEFSVINLSNQKVIKIVSNQAISFDSYIQGTLDNTVYLLDRTNKKQYKIDLSNKTVTKVGDIDSGVQIYDASKWETMTMYDVLKQNTYFTPYGLPEEIEGYEHIDVTDDYYYGYQLVDGGYDVYRISKQMPTVRYYITTLKDRNQVTYLSDYLYFMNNGCIYYYHDTTGVRLVLQNPELTFNTGLQFGVYEI